MNFSAREAEEEDETATTVWEMSEAERAEGSRSRSRTKAAFVSALFQGSRCALLTACDPTSGYNSKDLVSCVRIN